MDTGIELSGHELKRPISKGQLWIWVLPGLFLPLVASLFYFLWLGESPFARIVYGATKVFTLIWPILVCFVVLKESRPVLNTASWVSPAVLMVGIGSGLMISIVIFIAMETPMGDMARANANNIEQKVRDLGFYNHFWVVAIVISVLHSLLEEYYWRWFIYGKLTLLVTPLLAHIIAGLAFAAHHVVVLDQYFPLGWAFVLGLGVGVGGVIWSLQFARFKTLIGCWLSHMLVDFTLMWIGSRLLFT